MQAGVETYLYDFAQDIYGREITVRLFSFHRPEKKFDSVEALKKQMASDIAQGRYYVHRK
jgi:riboflavin kinase/FMN adenylyltransferase